MLKVRVSEPSGFGSMPACPGREADRQAITMTRARAFPAAVASNSAIVMAWKSATRRCGSRHRVARVVPDLRHSSSSRTQVVPRSVVGRRRLTAEVGE